jgi:hypothetical protein
MCAVCWVSHLVFEARFVCLDTDMHSSPSVALSLSGVPDLYAGAGGQQHGSKHG